MLKIILVSLVINSAQAIPVVSDGALYMIATNTLNSVRELNSILTEQQEFSETFEKTYAKVDQAIWKADRSIMWMEDMKDLNEADIENIDDFNSVLSSLKDNTQYLRAKLVKHHQENKEDNLEIIKTKKLEKKSIKRKNIYTRGVQTSLSPSAAQVETAKNTKDMAYESSLTNQKLDHLTLQVQKLLERLSSKDRERSARELREKNKISVIDKGVIKKKDLKI